jgi:hypothetical protein
MCRFSDPKCDGYQKILASIQEFITLAASSRSRAQDSEAKEITTIHTTALYTQSDRATREDGSSVAAQTLGLGQVRTDPIPRSGSLYKPLRTREPTEGLTISPQVKPNIPPRKLRACLREKNGDHVLSVFFEDRCLNIQFHRTVRVPDDGQTYNLPANLGTFPLFNIADYANTLSQDVVEKGGFFLPMYRK